MPKVGDINIRVARPGDASEIATVHASSWRDTFKGILPSDYLAGLNFRGKVDAWRKVIGEQDKFTILVAEDRVGVVGFATFEAGHDPKWEGHGKVSGIWLLSRFKGRGIGRVLLQTGMQSLIRRNFQRAYGWVLAGNPNVAFYEHSGAKFSGIEKNDEIGGLKITELAYVWSNLDSFR